MARRIAVLFPGQASQQVGMGRLATERFPAARAVFERVDAVLELPISATCFDGPAERLQETRWQQPAVFACSVALYAAWRAGMAPSDGIVAAAGHSLGEYGALVAAGALTLEDGARLVALRGDLMQRAADRVPGGMSAVQGLDYATVDAICREVSRPDVGTAEIVVLANANAPDQQVISGGLAALERASQAARAKGARRVIALKVAGAFHSPLMVSAMADLGAAVQSVPLQPCRFPVIANSSCMPLKEPCDVRAELIRQVTSPVRWVDSLREVASLSPDVWIDTGPGKVVAGLASRAVPGIVPITLSTLLDVRAPA